MGRGHSRRSETGQGILWVVLDGSGTLEVVWYESVDPRGGPGPVRGPSGRFGTDFWSLGEFRDGLLDIGEVRNG